MSRKLRNAIKTTICSRGRFLVESQNEQTVADLWDAEIGSVEHSHEDAITETPKSPHEAREVISIGEHRETRNVFEQEDFWSNHVNELRHHSEKVALIGLPLTQAALRPRLAGWAAGKQTYSPGEAGEIMNPNVPVDDSILRPRASMPERLRANFGSIDEEQMLKPRRRRTLRQATYAGANFHGCAVPPDPFAGYAQQQCTCERWRHSVAEYRNPLAFRQAWDVDDIWFKTLQEGDLTHRQPPISPFPTIQNMCLLRELPPIATNGRGRGGPFLWPMLRVECNRPSPMAWRNLFNRFGSEVAQFLEIEWELLRFDRGFVAWKVIDPIEQRVKVGYAIQSVAVNGMAVCTKMTCAVPVAERLLGDPQQSRSVTNLQEIPT